MMSKSGWGHGVWGTGLRYQKDYLVDGHGDHTIDCSRPFDAAADVSGGVAVLIVLAVHGCAAGFSFFARGSGSAAGYIRSMDGDKNASRYCSLLSNSLICRSGCCLMSKSRENYLCGQRVIITCCNPVRSGRSRSDMKTRHETKSNEGDMP